MKLSVKGLALGIGITWSIGQVLVGWVAIGGWGAEYVRVMSSIYIGFNPSFIGGIIGGVWGFADGFIGGALLAFFYNVFGNK
ncbi:MAG: bacteriophage holin [Chlamydiota bacterium]